MVLRIAFLGCGYVANMYRLTLPLQSELKLVAVYDRLSERSKQMSELTGARNCLTFEELLSNPQVDLVVNLTNPSQHYETTLACLRSGKHVYTEKPIAMRFQEAKQLVEYAKQRNLRLSSAPCTLLNEAAQTLWKAVRDEVVGKLRLVYAEMEDGMVHRMPVEKWVNEAGTPWPYVDEFATGCTVEHAGYALTWLCAMFGPAKSVTAFSDCVIPDKIPGTTIPTTPDFSVATIQFHSGPVVRLTCGIFASHDHQMRLFGDEGVMTLKDPRDDWSPLIIQRYVTFRRGRKLFPWGRRYPLVGGKRKQAKFRGSQRRNFCTGLADMAKAIASNKDCTLSSDFCLHVNEITLAIQNSQTNSTPYHLTTTFAPLLPEEWAR